MLPLERVGLMVRIVLAGRLGQLSVEWLVLRQVEQFL